MKKSLKVIYPLLGLFCIANCSDCNNFATPDCFGGNGDLDYPTFIRDFQPNCSKDFDNFIKYFGKLCVLKQVYPETKSQDVFKAFYETDLDMENKYKANLFSKNDYELNDDKKAIKNKFKEEWNIQKEYQNLLKEIEDTTDATKKKNLQKKAMEILKKHKDLTGTVKPLFVLQGTIEEPVKLNGVEIVEFSADVIISNDALNITWTITAAQSGGNIKIHRYYLEGFAKKFDTDNYFTIDFSTGATQKEKFTQKISLLEDNDILANVHLATIPECFVKCNKFKINIKVETAGYHMTYRFPYLKLVNDGVYEYEKNNTNSIESDLTCCFGLSKNNYLNTNIMFHYVSNKPIGTMEGAMPIYNGPYIASACKISNVSEEINKTDEKNETTVYDKTNLPDQKFTINKESSLYDTFDREFYITGIKSNKIDVDFKNLNLIKDIKDRYYSGLQQEDIKFSDTSNKILRVYAKRILNEIYHVGAEACTCTKVAALCQFVHYWMTYQDHERTHAMNPIEIFTYRRGICVDYIHLLLGLCSSIGINSTAKISGIGCNNFSNYEKHSWCVCYCPECCHCFEFDPTWNQCFQVGPEHIFLAKTHRVNDTADKTSSGDLHKGIEVEFSQVGKKIVIR